MPAILGWLNDARTSASRWNRLTRSASRENSSGRILIATSRFSFVSRARYTSPIPPLPSKAVISCDPSWSPIWMVMNWRRLYFDRERREVCLVVVVIFLLRPFQEIDHLVGHRCDQGFPCALDCVVADHDL